MSALQVTPWFCGEFLNRNGVPSTQKGHLKPRHVADATEAISSDPSGLISERGICFSTGHSFYREQSSLGRDLAVLAAALYKRKHGHLRVLDAMSGCGVRALRYLTQSEADFVLVNDCNEDLNEVITANLSRYHPQQSEKASLNPILEEYKSIDHDSDNSCSKNGSLTSEECVENNASHLQDLVSEAADKFDVAFKWQVIHQEANRLLLKCQLDRDFFDLIDVDSFGSDSVFIGPALSSVRFGGLLYLTSTDGRSSGGYRPENSLVSYGAYVKPTPYSNELGMRMLIGGIVKEAAIRKLNVIPIFSVYSAHGPVFRVLVSVNRGKSTMLKHYRFIYYCGNCGESRAVDWKRLGTTTCVCSEKVSDSIKMSGPLWTGPLHDGNSIQEMIALAEEWGWATSADVQNKIPKSKPEKLSELLHLMLEESHPGLPFGYIFLDEIARRAKVQTPPRDVLMQALREEGYITGRSQIAPNAIKTNCPMSRCITLAERLASEL